MENDRNNNMSEIVQVEQRERFIAALDAAVERSHADITAGRTKPAEDVFDRLQAKYAKVTAERSEP